MSTATLIGFAAVLIAFLGFAWALIANYGAWSRSEGARAEFERITGERVKELSDEVKQMPVFIYRVEQAEAALKSAAGELRMKEKNDHERELRDAERGYLRFGKDRK